jgi:extradiol dioxygenase
VAAHHPGKPLGVMDWARSIHPHDHDARLMARTLDDVGYTLDRHHEAKAPISMSLGKHTNDQMVSFYSRSPSGFDVEFGYSGRVVDEATWTVTQITKPSFWGHRRSE